MPCGAFFYARRHVTGISVEFTGLLEHRRAASDCCGALLDPAPGKSFTCRACGMACERVLGEPEVVAVHG